MYPTDRRYSEQHEWAAVDGETARLGITDFAQQELGDVVYVELPEAGKEVQAGETLGTIESVKAVSEVYSPFTGTVVSVNQALDERPELLNEDPYGDGWYCTMRLKNPAESDELLDAEGYKAFVAAEG